ncbi:MAG: DUF177 domain-containing protein [Syntrophobacterales bacterium]|jgi:uncharacterized protein|nr:DUF177 domain-containing protein [Syntrophobacterales bacterium]
MVIRVSEIEGEVRIKGAVEGLKTPGAEEGADVVFHTPVEYELLVRRSGDIMRVKGSVGCTLTLTCSKCMDEFAFPVDAELDIELAPKTLMLSASELELKGEDLDVYYYDGDEIEFDPFIYDEIMLNVPIKPVCGEDCKGLCEVCGANRNHEECRCAVTAGTLFGEKLKFFLN